MESKMSRDISLLLLLLSYATWEFPMEILLLRNFMECKNCLFDKSKIVCSSLCNSAFSAKLCNQCIFPCSGFNVFKKIVSSCHRNMTMEIDFRYSA